MLADDLPDNDDANTPDTIADTSVSTGFIPATTTIYFEDDGRYDSTYNGNCTMRFLGFTGNGKEAYINKVMVDTGTTVTGKDGKKPQNLQHHAEFCGLSGGRVLSNRLPVL